MKKINILTLLGFIPLIIGLLIISIQPFGFSPFAGIGFIIVGYLWAVIMFLIKLNAISKSKSLEENLLSSDELKQININYYVNVVRIQKCQNEFNPELEYQLKAQKSKLHALGVDTDEFEYEYDT